MKYEEVKNIFIGFITIFFFCLFVGTAILLFSTTRELDTARRLNDGLTERIVQAEDTNRELTKSLEQIRFLCEEFDSSVDRNIRTVREAVEIIEETKYYVQCIEVELGLYDSDSIYYVIDSWLESEGVSNEARD